MSEYNLNLGSGLFFHHLGIELSWEGLAAHARSPLNHLSGLCVLVDGMGTWVTC